MRKVKVNNASIALEKVAVRKQDLESYTEYINTWILYTAPKFQENTFGNVYVAF